MQLSIRSVAAVFTAALLVGASLSVGAFGVGALSGCAVSSPPDITPVFDPNLPGVDAAFDPSPAEGGQQTSGKPDASSKADGAVPVDAGTTPTVKTDASVVDATPGIPRPAPGEVLITEVMYDTFGTEPDSEWIELHSKASAVRTLAGLTLKDSSGRTHAVGAGLTIAPGAYLLLARSKTAAVAARVPAAVIAYEYGSDLPSNAGVLLTNGGTAGVSLLDGSVVITSAIYGGWFSQSGGSSVQLKLLDGALSTSKASWCLSLHAWTTGSEKGTPGAAEDCP